MVQADFDEKKGNQVFLPTRHNLGRDGSSSKKDPQFGQPLDETYQFSDLSSLKFSDLLREMGCKPIHFDRVKVKGGVGFHMKDTFWSPSLVLYLDPILPVSYCSLTSTKVQEYRIYVKFDVNVYTRWKLYGNRSHIDEGVMSINMTGMME